MNYPSQRREGNIEQLRKFVNVDKDDFTLVIAWLISTLSGVKPFPILILQGEQGTGKSTTCRVLRAFIDPSTVPLRSPPKEIRDLLVSASNAYLVVLDNLSGLNPEISDCLCRLSTGGGVDPRSLYTDNEQFLVDIQRPVIGNGIDDVASRTDLSERSIHLELPLIEADQRHDEKQFYADFDKAKNQIFGALLEGIVCALAHIETTLLHKKPRMADFAKWMSAAESGLGWKPGHFMSVYQKNQDNAVESSIQSSPIGTAIMSLMAQLERWTGTPTELLDALANQAGLQYTQQRSWPQSTKGMSNIIKCLMPSFRRLGIEIAKDKNRDQRIYEINKNGKNGKAGVYPSQLSRVSQPTADVALSVTDVTDSGLFVADSENLQASAGADVTHRDGYDGYSATYQNTRDAMENSADNDAGLV
ncbi:MAG: hypothetical protein PHY16_18235 [Methylobacter sp.]|nr:hypothetical protein [Methylobacter sp.]